MSLDRGSLITVARGVLDFAAAGRLCGGPWCVGFGPGNGGHREGCLSLGGLGRAFGGRQLGAKVTGTGLGAWWYWAFPAGVVGLPRWEPWVAPGGCRRARAPEKGKGGSVGTVMGRLDGGPWPWCRLVGGVLLMMVMWLGGGARRVGYGDLEGLVTGGCYGYAMALERSHSGHGPQHIGKPDSPESNAGRKCAAALANGQVFRLRWYTSDRQ